MSPPVGAVLPRTVLPGGLELLERHIPAGIDVGCPIYALQHNNEYVSNSFVYNPSRWIAGEAQVTGDSLERLHSVFNPFSVGPRACIGKPMAYLELMLTLARLVLTFDMKLPEGELRHIGEGGPQRVPGRRRVGEFQMVDNFVSEKEGLFALFKRRESDRLF